MKLITPQMSGKNGKKGGAKYKIPSDGEVLTAIYAAGSRLGTIDSQHKFIEMVRRELASIDPVYRLAPKRLRLLALKSGYVTVETRTREDDHVGIKLRECPVCGSKLKKLKNKTIYGGKITLGYSCPKCSYWTGAKLRRPVRYIFTRHIKGKPAGNAQIDGQTVF
jgi:hypothetical protein